MVIFFIYIQYYENSPFPSLPSTKFGNQCIRSACLPHLAVAQKWVLWSSRFGCRGGVAAPEALAHYSDPPMGHRQAQAPQPPTLRDSTAVLGFSHCSDDAKPGYNGSVKEKKEKNIRLLHSIHFAVLNQHCLTGPLE